MHTGPVITKTARNDHDIGVRRPAAALGAGDRTSRLNSARNTSRSRDRARGGQLKSNSPGVSSVLEVVLDFLFIYLLHRAEINLRLVHERVHGHGKRREADAT